MWYLIKAKSGNLCKNEEELFEFADLQSVNPDQTGRHFVGS